MKDSIIFKNINEEQQEKLISCLNARISKFKKDNTIASYIGNTNIIGVVLTGTAEIVRYDYNGNKTILEKLEKDSIFGDIFTSLDNSELIITATSNCEVLFMEYNNLIKRCQNACFYHSTLIDNILRILANKLIFNQKKIEILMNKTIREKLRAYFLSVSNSKGNKTFTLPFSYTDLADFLGIDRSAMTRELKNLKDDGIISTNGRKITLHY